MREGWRRVRLLEVADRTIGRTPPRKDSRYWTSDLARPFTTIANMQNPIISGGSEGVTELAETEGKAKRVPAGSLLLSFKLSLGRVGVTDRDVFTNEAIAWLQPKEGVLRDFLAIALETVDWESLAGPAVKGKTLNSKSLDAVEISLAPPKEQKLIVDLIHSVDDVIETATVTAQMADKTTKSLREQLTHGTTTLRVGEVLAAVREPVEVDPDGIYEEIGIRSHGKGVFEKKPVSGSEIGNKKVFWMQPGTLCFNIVFAWEGAVATLDESVRGKVASHRFPNYVSKIPSGIAFMSQFFQSNRGTSLLGDCSPGGAGRNRTLNRGRLMEATVEVPPPEYWSERVETIETAERKSLALSEYLDRLRALRSSLIAVLLSGKHAMPDSYEDFMEEAVE